MWEVNKFSNGDFEVKYPDNTSDGIGGVGTFAPHVYPPPQDKIVKRQAENLCEQWKRKHTIQEESNVLDILNFITNIKGIKLSNKDLIEIIRICS
jgi:hypothetical protein